MTYPYPVASSSTPGAPAQPVRDRAFPVERYGSSIAGEAPARLTTPVGDRDHVLGPSSAPLTLVMYGDYECPYCRAAMLIVDELRQLLGDRLRFAFRHFPLVNRHPRAELAAEAAEAAGAQGRFFEMHRRLLAHQDALARRDLARHAAELGLDVDRFRRELDDHRHSGRVRQDFHGGIDSGVRGTPTFYLDGVRYDGTVGVRELLAAIRRDHAERVDATIEDRAGRRTIPRVLWAPRPFPRPYWLS